MKIVTLKFGSLSDDTKDKSLTTFFKIFIILFGINFSLLLLSFFADSGSHRRFAEFGGYGWSAIFFFLAFCFFSIDMFSLFLSLKNRSFLRLDEKAKNSLFFYLVPCLVVVCLIVLGGIILFLFG